MADSAEFERAAEEVKQLATKPSDSALLRLYSLYKQATVGDNTTDKPGFFDLKGHAKWNAWGENRGMSKEEAKGKYVAFVRELQSGKASGQ